MSLYKIGRLFFLFALAAAACQTSGPTPYQAATGEYGYTETRTDDGLYEVSFQGNEATPYPVIENYLLYRAAELAREQGRDRFAIVRPDNGTVEIDQTSGHTVCRYSPASFSHFVYYPEGGSPEEASPDPEGVSYRATVLIALDDLDPTRQDQIVFMTDPTLENLGSCVETSAG